MKKLSVLMMIVLLVVSGGSVFADEEVTGVTGAEVEVNGILGDFDPSEPGPTPTDPNKWIKVTVPTAVLFYSEEDNLSNLVSPEYTIQNLSAKGVEVKVSGVNSLSNMDRVTTLKINDINIINNGSSVLSGAPTLFTMSGSSSTSEIKDTFELTGTANINGLVTEVNPSFQLVLAFSPILD